MTAYCAIFGAVWEVDSMKPSQDSSNMAAVVHDKPPAQNEKSREPVKVLGLTSIQAGRSTLRTRRKVLVSDLPEPWPVRQEPWPVRQGPWPVQPQPLALLELLELEELTRELGSR